MRKLRMSLCTSVSLRNEIFSQSPQWSASVMFTLGTTRCNIFLSSCSISLSNRFFNVFGLEKTQWKMAMCLCINIYIHTHKLHF